MNHLKSLCLAAVLAFALGAPAQNAKPAASPAAKKATHHRLSH